MKEKQLLTKELGAKIYCTIYLISFFCYPLLIGIDIFEPIKQETLDNLGRFLFYAGGGFFAIIGITNIQLFKK